MLPTIMAAWLLLAIAATLLADGLAAPSTVVLRILHHTTAPSSSASWEDTLLRDESRYHTSLASSGRSFVPIASGRQFINTPIYVVPASFGTPRQQLLVAIDTSNDAAWIPCSNCAGCGSASFATGLSSTYHPVPCGSAACSQVPNPSCSANANPCSFNMTYGSSAIAADLATDSLSLGTAAVVSGYTFGCIRSTTGNSAPPQGLLGMGRGPLSFPSQTRSLYGSTFSYCLPSSLSRNFSGTLRLGSAGQPKRIKTTPLLSSPRRPSLYYVNLTGIRVGSRTVPIPPSALAFDAATGAGTIVDSGTMFTRLVAPAYAAVRDEFRRQVGPAGGRVSSLGGFDTCFTGLAAAATPTVTLQFAGGMNVKLPVENVVIHSTSGSITCLAMAGAPENVNSVLNVIASMQQQNHRVLFDVANGRIGVARESCSV